MRPEFGASVRRKEDIRFITGKGHYTDDFDRPGQGHAHFIRSPYAHAPIKSVDISATKDLPGVTVLTGADLAGDKIGNLICGWMIHSKDGSPMKMAPHPALAHGKACHVGDPVAVVIADTLADARDAAELVKVDYEVLPAVADPAKAQSAGAPQIHELAPNNTIYQWHLGDQQPTEAAFKAAKHVTRLDLINNRLVPGSDRAARRSCRVRRWRRHAHPVEHHTRTHVARLVIAAFVGMAPEHKLRVIAPDVGGLWLEDQRVPRRPGGAVGDAANRRPVQWVAQRTEAFVYDAHGRDHITHRMASTRTARSPRCAPRRSPISAPTCRPSRPRCRPISTRPVSGRTTFRTSIARSTRSTPTRCRSTPIAARGGRKRPTCWNAWSSIERDDLGLDPADLRKRNFIKTFPHQTPVWRTTPATTASLDKALEISDFKGSARASATGAARQAARRRLLDLHRGLRHRTVPRQSDRSAAAWAYGSRRRYG